MEDEVFIKKSGEHIASLRKEQNITQMELGYKCDTNLISKCPI